MSRHPAAVLVLGALALASCRADAPPAADTKQAPTETAKTPAEAAAPARPLTDEARVCLHTSPFNVSPKVTETDWIRLCGAMMGPMRRSFTPPRWQEFKNCVLADTEKDAMESCEAKIRKAAAAARADGAPSPG